MSKDVSIGILAYEFGLHPKIAPLNPAFRPDATTLKLKLSIAWEPEDPATTLSSLEGALLDACPGMARHECRGPREYHVHRFAREEVGRAPAPPPVEPALALAHLIEHVMIDVVAFVTRSAPISGITGALLHTKTRFEIFVECPHPSVAALAAHVGPAWVSTLLRGGSLHEDGMPLLKAARALHDWEPVARDAAQLSRELDRSPSSVAASLAALERTGYACRENGRAMRGRMERYRVC